MSTVQEIIDYASRKIKNSVSTADKVADLNNVLTETYIKMKRVRLELAVYEDITTSNILSGEVNVFYSLPPYAKISDITKIMVAKDDLATEFEEYKYAGIEDDITFGQYFGATEQGTYWLLDDERAVEAADRKIIIYYYKRPKALSVSSLSEEPELEPDYHNLLKYGLIVELANQGHHPDTEIADYWQAKYDELLKTVVQSLSDRNDNAPLTTRECEERW
jgi:hypothetical protein